MTRGETSTTFKSPADMSLQEQCSFGRWLTNNAAIATIFVLGLVAIGIMSPGVPAGKLIANGEVATPVQVSTAID